MLIRLIINLRRPFSYLVPESGLEPPAYALRMPKIPIFLCFSMNNNKQPYPLYPIDLY